MATKKKSRTSTRSKTDALVDDLSKQVKKLSKQVKVAEKQRDALLKQLDEQVAKAKEAVRAVEKEARKLMGKAQSAVAPATQKVAETGGSTSSADSSWTVAQLRAEARSKNVSGSSRMTKAQLLAALK
ncbi:MAG: hypothetical protein WCB95_07650 [Aeromicrobium sp.]